MSKLKESSLHYHFSEGKNRVIFLFFSFGITLSICYIYSLELIFLYVKPFLPFEKPFIFTELTEALYITLKICIISGFFAIFPLICYQTWCFILPSCYFHERKKWSNILMTSNILAVIGWLLVYVIILPKLGAILLQFEIKNQLLTIQLETRISSYVKWSSQIFLATCLACQLPLASYIAFQVGFFNPKLLSENRRAAFLGSFLIAGLLSPPELFAQWLTTVFVFFCFEIILWLGMIFNQIAVVSMGPCIAAKQRCIKPLVGT